jgi:hypothetical protein
MQFTTPQAWTQSLANGLDQGLNQRKQQTPFSRGLFGLGYTAENLGGGGFGSGWGYGMKDLGENL